MRLALVFGRRVDDIFYWREVPSSPAAK